MNSRTLDPHADAFCRVIAEIIVTDAKRAPTPTKQNEKKRATRKRE